MNTVPPDIASMYAANPGLPTNGLHPQQHQHPQALDGGGGAHASAIMPSQSPHAFQIGPLPALDSRTQLFVGNLPFRVRWQDLKDLMRKCGTVLRADVALTPGDGRSRGFGIVLFAKREDAIKAIEMYNGFNWQNRVLDVRIDSQDPTGAIAMAEANRLAAMQHSPASQKMTPLPYAMQADHPFAHPSYQANLAIPSASSTAADASRSSPVGSPALMSAPLHQPKSSAGPVSSPDRQSHYDQQQPSPVELSDRVYPPPGMMLVPISMMGNFGGPQQPGMRPHGPPGDSAHNLQGYYHAVQHRPSPSSPVPLPPGYANRHLFIGNLPFNCQWQELKDLMRGAGNVLRADIAQGSDGRSRGFGSVLFATPQDAERAVQMFNGFDYNGRALKVHFDKFSATAGPPPSLPPHLQHHGMLGAQHFAMQNGRSSPMPPNWAPLSDHALHPLAHQQSFAHMGHDLSAMGPDEQYAGPLSRDRPQTSNATEDKPRRHPASIELPPPNPFAFGMLTGGLISPRQGNMPPMTPSMPAFTLGAFPPTPPVYPSFFSPGTGMGPTSPLQHDIDGVSYFSGAMGNLNAAPGAPVERSNRPGTSESYFPNTVPPGEDVPPSRVVSRRPSAVDANTDLRDSASTSRRGSTDTTGATSDNAPAKDANPSSPIGEGLDTALGQLNLSNTSGDIASTRRRSYVPTGALDFGSSDWRKRIEAANVDLSQRRASYDTSASTLQSLTTASSRAPFPSAPGSNASGASSPPRPSASTEHVTTSPPGASQAPPLNAATFAAFHSAGAIGSGISSRANDGSKKPAFGTSIWASK